LGNGGEIQGGNNIGVSILRWPLTEKKRGSRVPQQKETGKVHFIYQGGDDMRKNLVERSGHEKQRTGDEGHCTHIKRRKILSYLMEPNSAAYEIQNLKEKKMGFGKEGIC